MTLYQLHEELCEYKLYEVEVTREDIYGSWVRWVDPAGKSHIWYIYKTDYAETPAAAIELQREKVRQEIIEAYGRLDKLNKLIDEKEEYNFIEDVREIMRNSTLETISDKDKEFILNWRKNLLLKFIQKVPNEPGRKGLCLYECHCGRRVKVERRKVRNEIRKSCGCSRTRKSKDTCPPSENDWPENLDK